MTSARLPQDPPSVEYLREALDYDPETGILTWRERPRSHFKDDTAFKRFNTVSAGRPAGHIDGRGYISVRISSVGYPAHRIIWALSYGRYPSDQIDHINQVRDDNRLSNLREVSGLENLHNQPRRIKNRSGHNGVHFDRKKKRWRASIKANGLQDNLGSYTNIEDAVAARKAAEIKYGYHPLHGTTTATKAQEYVEGCVRPDNKSGVTGCCKITGRDRWWAWITIDGKRKGLGGYATLEEAAAARKAAEIEHGVTNRKGRGKVALDLS